MGGLVKACSDGLEGRTLARVVFALFRSLCQCKKTDEEIGSEKRAGGGGGSKAIWAMLIRKQHISKMGFPHSLQRLESPKLRRCACFIASFHNCCPPPPVPLALQMCCFFFVSIFGRVEHCFDNIRKLLVAKHDET